MTRRRQILEELRRRVQQIRRFNDYETDAGQTVFLGEVPILGENDPDVAVAMIVGEDLASEQPQKIRVQMPVEFQALAKPSPSEQDTPWITTEDVLGDIKKAVESGDRSLGGLVHPRDFERASTRTLERESGHEPVGVGISYLVSYTETFGSP